MHRSYINIGYMCRHMVTSPDVVPDPGPAHEVSVRLYLGVEHGLHAAGVQGVRLREVHDGEPVLHIRPHVLNLG